MPHPDVGLYIRPAAALEMHRHEGTRDDIVAVLRELEARPLLPVVARRRHRHRPRSGREDLGPEPLVSADPGAVVKPVRPAPEDVALHRREPITLLPGRA